VKRAAALVLLAACGSPPGALPDEVPAAPPGFPPVPAPQDNPITAAKMALGRRLFFDKSLSRTSEIACASCHRQENAFADPRPVSVGVDGQRGTRNAPALVNLAYGRSFFWDGGVDTLERQAIAPITSPLEMDLRLGAAVARVAADPSYGPMFERAFGGPPTPERLTGALATFVRTLVSGASRYDRYRRGDTTALGPAERRGMDLFFGERAECFHCHDGFNFTNERYANDGSYLPGSDVGRQRITQSPNDRGRFKVPTLRNVAVTAPYLHDGSLATLEEVVDQYVRGGRGDESTDPTIHPLPLDEGEQRDLVAFLRALTDESFLRDPRFAP
jgi:cytochrome c peroxidase